MSWLDDTLAMPILELLKRRPDGLSFRRVDLMLSNVRSPSDSLPFAVLKGLAEEGYLESPRGRSGVFALSERGRQYLNARRGERLSDDTKPAKQ
jgi:DNA-binding PadR family transcriptional regulator